MFDSLGSTLAGGIWGEETHGTLSGLLGGYQDPDQPFLGPSRALGANEIPSSQKATISCLSDSNLRINCGRRSLR